MSNCDFIRKQMKDFFTYNSKMDLIVGGMVVNRAEQCFCGEFASIAAFIVISNFTVSYLFLCVNCAIDFMSDEPDTPFMSKKEFFDLSYSMMGYGVRAEKISEISYYYVIQHGS